MKKQNTVTKHDIIRVLKSHESKLNYLLDTVNILSYTIKSYIKYNKDEVKFKKYLEKQNEEKEKKKNIKS